jgi:hypothetical protein
MNGEIWDREGHEKFEESGYTYLKRRINNGF